MKIKSIAAICKKNKNIAIFERYSDDGDILTQYIGDGSAVYPVVGLPKLDKESLLTIFDVPEKDRDNYFVKTLGVPAGISFEDTDETERHVEREGISIIYSGRTLKPIRTTRGLVFIESRYLSPVADVLDVLELYERRTTEGTPYIVAKAGFLLQAVIMPSVHLLTAKRRLIFAKSSIREITERHQRLNRWRKSLSKRITIIGRFAAGSQSWKQNCERRVRVNE